MLLSRGGHGQRRCITSQGVLVRPTRRTHIGSRWRNSLPADEMGGWVDYSHLRCPRSAGSYCRPGHKPPRRLTGTSSHRRVRAYSLGHKRVRHTGFENPLRITIVDFDHPTIVFNEKLITTRKWNHWVHPKITEPAGSPQSSYPTVLEKPVAQYPTPERTPKSDSPLTSSIVHRAKPHAHENCPS